MAGIDNNTLLYLRGDSFEDLSPSKNIISNSGVTINNDPNYGKVINVTKGNKFSINNNSFAFGLNNFTIEFWIYLPYLSSYWYPIFNNDTLANFGMYISNSGDIRVDFNGVLGGNLTIISRRLYAKTWYHIAITNFDGNLIIYIDGKKSMYGNLTSGVTTKNLIFGYNSASSSDGTNMYMKSLRLSNVARYTEDFTPPPKPYNSITINKTNQTDTNIEFNIEKLGQETINKVEVLVNGTVSKTYSDNYDNIDYLIDTELCIVGNNNITIRVTFDDTYTEELSLTHKVTVDELPIETPLLDTVERVKFLTELKQNEKNMLSSILTSKNVEVTEEDKMGDLISKVDLLGEYDDGKLWLYRNGNEYIDVTGGLIKGGLNFGTASYLKENSFISFSASSTNSGSGNVHLCTSNIIELSKYSKLCAEYESSDLNTNSSISIVVYSSNNIVTSSSIKIAESYSQKSGRDILTLDISRLSDNYVAFGLNTWGTPQSITGKIYKVWLEK